MTLPQQPVPELEKTCRNLLHWLKPLVDSETFTQTSKVVDQFQSKTGEGPKLQNLLANWIQNTKVENFAAPLWRDLYLSSRHPLIIEGNVFFALEKPDDQTLKGLSGQEQVVARLIHSVLQFITDIQAKYMFKPPGNKQICMHQYTELFATSRIPGPGRDTVRTGSLDSDYIIAICKGHLYKLKVRDLKGIPLPEELIRKAVTDILERPVNDQSSPGIFTTLQRDDWARIRRDLELIPENSEKLNTIDEALFVLCLDETVIQKPEEVAENMLLGPCGNRWFDKSLQFIVTKNCQIGLNMEHTCFDGTVTTHLLEEISHNLSVIPQENNCRGDIQDTLCEPLVFALTSSLQEELNDARKTFNFISSDYSFNVLLLPDHGIDRLKKFKCSPDGFVQLALQYAYYKLFGSYPSTYGAVSMRHFDKGRIEVLYTVTEESREFVHLMCNPDKPIREKQQALHRATTAHVERVHSCQQGCGIDSHLMALRTMYNWFGRDVGLNNLPEFFSDLGYERLFDTKLCTSTTSSSALFLAGYGPVVKGGFGIRYIKDRNSLRVIVTGRKESAPHVTEMSRQIKRAFTEMINLMEDRDT